MPVARSRRRRSSRRRASSRRRGHDRASPRRRSPRMRRYGSTELHKYLRLTVTDPDQTFSTENDIRRWLHRKIGEKLDGYQELDGERKPTCIQTGIGNLYRVQIYNPGLSSETPFKCENTGRMWMRLSVPGSNTFELDINEKESTDEFVEIVKGALQSFISVTYLNKENNDEMKLKKGDEKRKKETRNRMHETLVGAPGHFPGTGTTN